MANPEGTRLGNKGRTGMFTLYVISFVVIGAVSTPVTTSMLQFSGPLASDFCQKASTNTGSLEKDFEENGVKGHISVRSVCLQTQ
jgi:hypothetical protein